MRGGGLHICLRFCFPRGGKLGTLGGVAPKRPPVAPGLVIDITGSLMVKLPRP